ncbi:MAG: methylthioribulose 1-phosphate dehydratase [Pyrinomonadaceae bacterium]
MIETKIENRPEEGEQIGGFDELAVSLSEIGRRFYARGWAMGTSGNFSAVVSRNPLRLAITSSGVDKSLLASDHVLITDANGNRVAGSGRPSAETLLHLMVVRARGAGAVLHTHSIWSHIISDMHALEGGVNIEGFEMLKGLAGVSTHEHREWVPIIENSQDMATLSLSVEEALNEHPGAHGFLLRRHGLYTWGRDLPEANRHVEILEFLLEVLGRTSHNAARALH